MQQQNNTGSTCCHQTGLCNILKIPFASKARPTALSNSPFPAFKTDCSKFIIQYMEHKKKRLQIILPAPQICTTRE